MRLNKFLADYHQLQQETKKGADDFRTVQDELIALTAAAEKTQARLSVLDHEIDAADRQTHQFESELMQCTSQISNQDQNIDQRQLCHWRRISVKQTRKF